MKISDRVVEVKRLAVVDLRGSRTGCRPRSIAGVLGFILHQNEAGLPLCVEHCAIGAERQPLAVAHDESGADKVRARGQIGDDSGQIGGKEGLQLGRRVDYVWFHHNRRRRRLGTSMC